MRLLNSCFNRRCLSGISVDHLDFQIGMNCLALYGSNCSANGKNTMPEKGQINPLSPAIKSISQLPEDLIIFKAISRRPQDMEDIKAIIARHSDLDKERVLSVIREFADILESEDIYDNIKKLLK